MAYILETDQLTKNFTKDLQVFAQVRLNLKEGEKAGLVGPNGAGKTTLLNCLSGRDTAYEGSVKLAPFAAIGFLEQSLRITGNDTLLSSVLKGFDDILAQRKRIEELEHAMSGGGSGAGQDLDLILKRYGNERDLYERSGGFALEAQVRRVLSGLGFREEQYDRPVESFSGGEKTRIGLSSILVREYPLLLLDEPTNHLDLDSIEWLESFLKEYPGALLIVSHDRYFLDKVTETTFDLEDGRLKRYSGNYSRYAEQKAQDRQAQTRAYEKQKKEIEETESFINQYRAGIKSRQARGRQSRLNRLERIEKPGERRAVNMGKAQIGGMMGDITLALDHVSFGYTDKHLFENLTAEIRSGERVALLGPNGAGKTTILKLIMGMLKPRKGGIYFGPSIKPSYFDQEHQTLQDYHSVLDEILYSYNLSVEEARSSLARFLFFTEDLEKRVGSLSGGERGRLSLLKLTLEKGNFLILDEPTNHLDIITRGVMENYLDSFEGALLMVSHDRYFIDTLADRVLELTKDGLISYPGNYTDYRERKERALQSGKKASAQTPAKGRQRTGDTAVAQEQVKVLDRYARARLRQRIQELEKEIFTLEANEMEITESLSNPDTYGNDRANDLVKELNEQLQNIQLRLPEAYQEWEEAGRRLEEG